MRNLTDSPWLLAAVAAAVALRLVYFFHIGFSLRRAERDESGDKQARYRNWLRFKRRASLILLCDGVALAAVILFSLDTIDAGAAALPLRVAGAVMAAAGIWIKSSAYRAIGVKGYYWHNFFCDEDDREFVARGVYKYLNNPMYGPGYLHAVGFPLVFLSAWGLAVAAFDWAIVWAFYFAFERRHTESCLGEYETVFQREQT